MRGELSEFRERFEKRHDHGWEIKKKGKKLIACFYGLVPKELIHAAGMVPIQLVEERDSRYEEQAGLQPYFCGLSKNLTGQIFSQVFDYVDGIMVATVCDTNRRIFDVWEHRKLFPHSLLVRLPVKSGDRAVRFYAQECRRLAHELEKISGVAVTEQRLRESIAQFNENRVLFGKLYEVLPQSGISGEEAVYVLGAALVTPVEEHNALLRQLLASLNAPSVPDRRTRLMLCAINLNMAVEVIRLAEKFGATVVTNDMTHNARYGSHLILLEADPFESLARGYLGQVPAPGEYPFEARANDIRERMRQAEARGMIYLLQLYCDAYAFEYAVLKERFDQWNLKHLKLEAEDTPSSIKQLNVRVQSFVESLL